VQEAALTFWETWRQKGDESHSFVTTRNAALQSLARHKNPNALLGSTGPQWIGAFFWTWLAEGCQEPGILSVNPGFYSACASNCSPIICSTRCR